MHMWEADYGPKMHCKLNEKQQSGAEISLRAA
jgi:hypothetical protein